MQQLDIPIPSATPVDIAASVESLLERGFAVVPGLLSVSERQEASDLLDGLVATQHGCVEHNGFGFAIHPLCTREARLCRFYANPVVNAICAAALEDDVHLTHTGARITDGSHGRQQARIGWHNHAYTPDLSAIKPGDPRRGQRPTRLLYGWYLDGSTADSGPLVVLPRRYDEPLAPPAVDTLTSWPGEIEVEAPPGSAVIFTIDLWHAAKAGRGEGRRRLMGAHVQGWKNSRAHPEDHLHDGPGIAAAIAADPVFARLMRGPSA